MQNKVQVEEEPQIIIENDINFYRSLAQQNLDRMYLISKIFLWIILFLVLLNIGNIMFLNDHTTYHRIYIIPYALLFSTNCLVLVFAHPNNFKANTSIEYYKKFEENVALFVCWMLMLSLGISMLDQIFYQHTIIYSIAAVICTSFFVMRIRYFIAPFIVAIIGLALNFFNQHEDFYHYSFEMQLVIMLTPILIIVANMNYRRFVESYKQQKYLCRETNRANKLASDLAKANTELKRLSYTDELTHIANRRGFQKYVAELKERSLSFNLTVLMLDIDYFKNFNDYYGHAYGDMVLSRVSTVLDKVASSTNCFTARWGGEEFILLAPDKEPEEIIVIYNRIIREINHYEFTNAASSISNTLTFSIGAYRGEVKSQDDIQDFLHKADSLLYEIKESGRNGFKLMEGEEVIYKYQPNTYRRKP
ncbi:GGDEF domain-containing protein [Rummeliibacillus pycnus]|uniref:GGDEF domain-containing protein n=1 Tax=Rummeliibacillus pycnus TaxID=101070 RepID=UPI0037C9795C